jgi:methylthioribulose-1-phosphate dehydratase
MVPETRTMQSEVEALCATARWCYRRGWLPATSGNFSVRAGAHIFITGSGLDKGKLTPGDLIEIDLDGRQIAGQGKPSAEAGLHQVIYRHRVKAHAILHVHSLWNTLLSGRLENDGEVKLEGYELLKGLSGVATHTHQERVPIITNSQNYGELTAKLETVLKERSGVHGVLLSRHGLYTWGQSVAEARRHLEALEFLFEVEERRLTGRIA